MVAQRLEAWPAELKHQYGLRLSRGEVAVIDRILHAIVGFDVQTDSYQCWIRQMPCAFDTTSLVTVSRNKAHFALRDLHARDLLPPLPLIDGSGLVVGTVAIEDDEGPPLQKKQVPVSHMISTPPVVPVSHMISTPPVASFETVERLYQEAKEAVTLPASRDEPIFDANCFQPEPPTKVCVLYTVLRIVVGQLLPGFSHLSNLLRRQQSLDGPLLRPESHDKNKIDMEQQVRLLKQQDGLQAGLQLALQDQEESSLCVLSTFPEYQSPPHSPQVHITLPVVRPAAWQDVKPLFKSRNLIFDERGIKETMTVRASRWSAFVDRQRERLRRELDGAQCHQQRAASFAGGNVVEEDLVELELLLDRMEDWKDLTRYEGKSIGMAAAHRGGEMQLRVLAFEERTDRTGIDFIRLAYRKSVEVRNWLPSPAERPRSAAWGVLSAVLPCLMASAGITEKQLEQWVELLQRPDVAKYAIALIFRSALQKDGVHLEFCDPHPSDAEKT